MSGEGKKSFILTSVINTRSCSTRTDIDFCDMLSQLRNNGIDRVVIDSYCFSKDKDCVGLRFEPTGFEAADKKSSVYISDGSVLCDINGLCSYKWFSDHLDKDMSELEAVGKDGNLLYWVENQTPELCMAAVRQNGCAVQYVDAQTPEICLEAVRQNGAAVKWIREQTEEVCMEALRHTREPVLEYMRKRTPEICLEAVKRNYANLYSVRNPTREMWIEALKQNGRNLLNRMPSRFRDEEACIAAVSHDGFALGVVPVKERTEKVCLAAVQENGNALVYLSDPSPKICMEALKKDSFLCFKYVPKSMRTPSLSLYALVTAVTSGWKRQEYLEKIIQDIPDLNATKKYALDLFPDDPKLKRAYQDISHSYSESNRKFKEADFFYYFAHSARRDQKVLDSIEQAALRGQSGSISHGLDFRSPDSTAGKEICR